MAHEVFISYSHKNAAIADAICHTLEENGIRCWYAPRNIQPGQTWAGAITEALEHAKLMVLVFTDESNSSVQVLREVNLAVSSGIPIIPLKLTASDPSNDMKYYLQTLHWLDAVNSSQKAVINNLLQLAKAILGTTAPQQMSADMSGSQSVGSMANTASNGKKRSVLIAGISVIVVAIVIGTGIWIFSRISAKKAEESQQQAAILQELQAKKDPVQENTAEEKSQIDDSTVETSKVEGFAVETGQLEDSPHADEYLYSKSTYSDFYQEGISLEKYFGEDTTVIEIPEVVDGLPVIWIDQKCFEGYENIEKIVLPETIEGIGYRAFYGLEKLKDFNIPEHLHTILGWAFAHTGIESIELPETVETLDYGAFYSCENLTNVVLSSKVDNLGENTFRYCGDGLRVTIPNADIKIDTNAFESGDDVTIIGVAGSYAETYAKAMKLTFEAY